MNSTLNFSGAQLDEMLDLFENLQVFSLKKFSKNIFNKAFFLLHS